jgi:starch-binding outer membrane protein, SusD/RagB family
MKIKIILLLVTFVALLNACNELDLNPLSEGSSENWYSDETEINMALNDLYRGVFWPLDHDKWTDDWTARTTTNDITGGTLDGEWKTSRKRWGVAYKAISRSNTVLQNLVRAKDELPDATINRFEAEAKFVRAAQYSYLISHWGDVPFFETVLDLDESFTLSRTPKEEILEIIYNDFDFAVANLPESYGSSELKRATKGAAMAYKARIALYMGDWSVARSAAKACMDLGVYSLYPDFRELFLASTQNPNEAIFTMPQSTELGVSNYHSQPRFYMTRNTGGWTSRNPSWELWCSYLCTDGLPIDESPLFDPRDPFKNRDPRMTMTIVEFQTPWLGFIYQPHPDSLEVLNLNTGEYQKNNDTRANAQYASFNAMVWKKKIDDDWLDNKAEHDRILMRYADVLLMYAEASIELNQIDQSVLDAMNMVRARAYGVDKSETSAYPEIITTNQAELRKIVRIERRMELAFEGLRYMDIIRWRLAEKVLNTNIYGMLDPPELKEKVVDEGLWFFPETPEVDEDGVPNFDALNDAGYIKLLAIRNFPDRQYLWPIPTKEILINENLSQNEGY